MSTANHRAGPWRRARPSARVAASLPEAKAIVDRAPCELRVFEWRDPAANAMALLRAMGATASMRKVR